MANVDPKPDLTLYEVSAQAIPTLVIALAVGLRDLRVIRSRTMTMIALEMVVALGATTVCIFVLASGEEPSDLVESIVKWSFVVMAFAFMGLIWRWFTHPDDRHAGRVPLTPPPAAAASKRHSPVALAVIGLLALLLVRRR